MDRVLRYELERAYDSIFTFMHEQSFPHKVCVQLKKNMEQVRLNGEPAFLRSPLHVGDLLELKILETDSSEIVPVKMPLDIVYEDEDILVINKPAGMPVHPSIRHYQDTLANGLMFYFREESSPFVFRCMNRLDRDTSGLTLVAKNPFSSAMLQRQVKERQLHRTYYVVVEGELPSQGTIDAPIGRVEESVILRQIDWEKGQPAITHYTRLDFKNGYSLAEVSLETGRTHQIRVHMKSIGHPLPGDFLYNPDNNDIGRQALHSYRLTFLHPVTKEFMDFSTALPADMAEILYG